MPELVEATPRSRVAFAPSDWAPVAVVLPVVKETLPFWTTVLPV